MYSTAELWFDDHSHSDSPLLDLYRRPAPLPLGHSIAEVSRDPYPDPHDSEGKNLVADLRAFEKLPRQVTLTELRANKALRKVKFLKNVRLIVSAISDAEYVEILKMAGIVATPGIPLP